VGGSRPHDDKESKDMSIVSPNRYPYETVAASQTAQILGGTGAVGDYLHRIVVTVTTTGTSTLSVLDNSTTVLTMAANTPVGVYSLEINAASASGPWKITTGAGVTVMAVGFFTA
jgi:hypothetical protein